MWPDTGTADGPQQWTGMPQAFAQGARPKDGRLDGTPPRLSTCTLGGAHRGELASGHISQNVFSFGAQQNVKYSLSTSFLTTSGPSSEAEHISLLNQKRKRYK